MCSRHCDVSTFVPVPAQEALSFHQLSPKAALCWWMWWSEPGTSMRAIHFVALLLILIQGFELGIFFAGLIGFLEMPLLHACILWLKLLFSPDLHQQMQSGRSGTPGKASVESSAGSLQSLSHHDPSRLRKNNTTPSASRGLSDRANVATSAVPGDSVRGAQVQTAAPWSLRWLQAGHLQGCQWTSCARLPHAFSRSQPCGSCLWSAHHLQVCGRGVKSPDPQVSSSAQPQLIRAEHRQPAVSPEMRSP